MQTECLADMLVEGIFFFKFYVLKAFIQIYICEAPSPNKSWVE